MDITIILSIIISIIVIIILIILFTKSQNSAPNFFVKYKNQAKNYTGSTGEISPDGNTIKWTNFSNKTDGYWIRAVSLPDDEDPTIISGGEVPMSKLPQGYINMPETGITSYNWLNTRAKWPVLIRQVPGKSNMYYMKQGTHYDPNIDVLIAS